MQGPKQSIQAAASRQLIITLSMQKALHILEMPIQELKGWLESEIEKNPALDFKLAPISTNIDPDTQQSLPSLGEHLLAQAREFFTDPKQLHILESLIGCVEPNGFIKTPPQELAEICSTTLSEIERFLKILKTFDPPGIGAENLQECLLIQLKQKNKENSIAYQVVRDYFPELLQSRFLFLQRKLRKSPYEIQTSLQKDLRGLNFQPSHAFTSAPIQTIQPDLLIENKGSTWKVLVYQSDLPQISIKTLQREEKLILKTFISDANMLFTGLRKRKKILQKIAIILLEKQKRFFEGKTPIKALNLKEIAAELSIHESTLSRALSGKYLECPRGTLSLRSFFSRAYLKGSEKNISRVSVLETLKKLIEEEDKTNPLSDQQLVEKLRKENFPCARRTITKYRKKLEIGSTKQRRQFAKDKSTIL